MGGCKMTYLVDLINLVLSINIVWLYVFYGYFTLFHVQLLISALIARKKEDFLYMEEGVTERQLAKFVIISAVLFPFTFVLLMVKWIKMLRETLRANSINEGDTHGSTTDSGETEE